MSIHRRQVDGQRFNRNAILPYELRPLRFTEVYLAEVTTADFRRNERGELGTRTATLHADGVAKLRRSWVYLDLVDNLPGPGS